MPPDRVVVVGASAGGLEALAAFVASLPSDLPAPVVVVVRVEPGSPDVLPEVIARWSPLPVHHVEDGEVLARGTIGVAPPDWHVVVEPDRLRLTRSPKEHGARPSVDTLFRSAADSFGAGSVAVVLSGTLDDGTAGLLTVIEAGGFGFVQDPKEAAFPAMPEHATRHVPNAHVASAARLGGLVADALRMPVPESSVSSAAMDDIGGPLLAALTCPDCGGPLWEDDRNELARYGCRVGHAYSLESLAEGQLVSLEQALWTAVVALEEREDLSRRLARRMGARGRPASRERHLRHAEHARRQREIVQAVVLSLVESPSMRNVGNGSDDGDRDEPDDV